jgi:hypothetical protein
MADLLPLDLVPQIFTEMPSLDDMLNMFLVCREWTEKIRKWTNRATIQALFTTHPAIPHLFRIAWANMRQEDAMLELDDPDWPWYRYLTVMRDVKDLGAIPHGVFRHVPAMFTVQIALSMKQRTLRFDPSTHTYSTHQGEIRALRERREFGIAAYHAFVSAMRVFEQPPRDDKERKRQERITRTIVARFLLVKALMPWAPLRDLFSSEDSDTQNAHICDLFLPRDAWPAAIELLRFAHDSSHTCNGPPIAAISSPLRPR